MTERVVTRADREAAVEALRECGPSVDAMTCPSCLAGPGQGHDPDCNADRRPRERGVLVCKCDYAAMLKSDLATLQAETAKLITRNAQLEFELGKVRGELEGIRAGWSVSNHEAWEQGYVAGQFDHERENPFPKPEKKESE